MPVATHPSAALQLHNRRFNSNSFSPSLLRARRRHAFSRRIVRITESSNGTALGVKAYMDESNSFSGFAKKVIGSLPVIGLIARIVSGEGGIGGDLIDFAEFRRRVGNKSSITDSDAFYEFQDLRGRAGDPLHVLLCCWLAAIGAGLLKSEEILDGAARLRLSNDIEFEEQYFMDMMKQARMKREKLRAPNPSIPMEIRAEKAVDAIYVCCFGMDPMGEEEQRLLCIMLGAVFPTVGKQEVERIVKAKANRIAEGSEDEAKLRAPKSLSKEAVRIQLKDLEFLKRQNGFGIARDADN
ncbi:unnamed protein product [Cuscuta campestris]|uniref:Photosystem I assembly factor PSA3, chloroplastic n=1 Tax=Cuscuta campestris TaxID=132261 RepID=A0A484LBR2_9ASTE|nr:unnamed protein product [Cuscuta campestris]